jgi:CheY-like chemotaxis protein
VLHYLTKPVRRERLLEAVAEAMGTLVSEPSAPDPLERRFVQLDAKPILVVEDTAVNQLVIKAMLAKRGFDVHCADNGRAALAMLAAEEYALVFMDCQMPELDGYDATALIRDDEVGTDERLTIVAMTANAMKGDRDRCIAVGMDDYLSKPLRPAQLDAVLGRWLGRPAASTTNTHEATATLVDDVRMRVLRDEYPEVIEQLFELFLDGAPPLLAELRTSAEAGDGPATRHAAHKLKGSSLNVGAIGLATLAGEVEQTETANPSTLTRLDQALQATGPALRAAIARPPGES